MGLSKMQAQQEIEKTKPGFAVEKLIAAREKTWEAVAKIAQAMKPGMDEEEAYARSRAILRGMGSEKDWHRPWVRFGASTIHPYGVLPAPGIKLKENDIFFIDIGPVWDGYEGDAGDTFIVGADPELARCRSDAKNIFDRVRARWETERLSGEALFRYAQSEAAKLGWLFNTRGAAGHRLSDFPHAVYFKGNLLSQTFTPSPCAWVMEIQIRHPEKEFGAFYEDLLF